MPAPPVPTAPSTAANDSSTCEWIVTAVDSSHLDMDEELTKLLRGE
ncbi:DUF6192 family protein [Streptomyces lacrimifluminis]|nr:DUF6192 family protein [Streptomyces lacrimifluminis]